MKKDEKEIIKNIMYDLTEIFRILRQNNEDFEEASAVLRDPVFIQDKLTHSRDLMDIKIALYNLNEFLCDSEYIDYMLNLIKKILGSIKELEKTDEGDAFDNFV